MRSTAEFATVCFWDAAIDLGAEGTNLERFIETRDMDALAFKPSLKPTRFYLRPLSNEHGVQLLGQTNNHMRRFSAFRAALVRVEDLRDESFSSPTFVPSIKLTEDDVSRRFALLSDAEMALFDLATVMEIGEVALGRAFLPKGSAGGFVLPPTSVRLLTVMKDLYAAMTRSISAGQNGKTPPERSSEAATSSASAGGATAVDPSQRIADLVTTSGLADRE